MTLLYRRGRIYRELTDAEVAELPDSYLRGTNGRPAHPVFLTRISMEYDGIVATGEKRPQAVMAEKYGVSISAVSRWLKEARRR